jgi:hypothetical protein
MAGLRDADRLDAGAVESSCLNITGQIPGRDGDREVREEVGFDVAVQHRAPPSELARCWSGLRQRSPEKLR